MNLVTVANCFNPIEAQLARARLEVAGFHPAVSHELAALSNGGYSMAAGGIKVQVPDNEAEEARQFLAPEDQSSNETPE